MPPNLPTKNPPLNVDFSSFGGMEPQPSRTAAKVPLLMPLLSCFSWSFFAEKTPILKIDKDVDF
jgi:hypothetical protein